MIDFKNYALNRLKVKIKENPKNFVAIIGSGMSVPAGLPDWDNLKMELLSEFENKYRAQDPLIDNKLDELCKISNYWLFFQEIKSLLGEHDYTRIIRERLNTNKKDIPEAYKQLWKLGIDGVITFNLDKFILDSYSDVFSRPVDYATGGEPYKFRQYCNTFNSYVMYAHGIISDESTWIFTEREKNSCYRNADFKNFLTTILNAKSLIIIGFNPQEQTFLSLLNDIGFQGQIAGFDNYYFAPNISAAEQKSLEDYGLSVIPYTPSNKDHPEINQALQLFYDYYPFDANSGTVYTGRKYEEEDIPEMTKVYVLGIDKLREILNGVIANIIPPDSVPTKSNIEKLHKFYETYSDQLYAAWMINITSKNSNNVHGLTVVKNIGRGTFGNVYEAYDSDENKYALKVLLTEVKDKPEYLDCFRRGVNSMKILKSKNVEGMVKIHASYEVPACIIMDYIEGSTLGEAVHNNTLISLDKKLQVIIAISKIIYSAHQLEEGILHRDLKPENIILEDFYCEDEETIKVKVLDFDLSWHKDAIGLTVPIGAVSQGFMAPEQVSDSHTEATRNTAVDVFSIGMLIYYILTKRIPLPNQHQFNSYREELIKNIKDEYHFHWKCLPSYLAETIVKATAQEQSKRIGLDVLINNISIAKEMYINKLISSTHPLFLRELAERIDPVSEIYDDNFGRKVVINSSALGKEVVLELSQQHFNIILNVFLSKTRKEYDARDGVAKYLVSMKNKALAKVDKKLFYLHEGDVLLSEVKIHIASYLRDSISLNEIDVLARSIQSVRADMEFPS